ncbi:MAG TPA: hypothetical protein DC047_16765 [Blastocatellia bacterium]|nr:hypothetical protein [Blastocatellia bacterium]
MFMVTGKITRFYEVTSDGVDTVGVWGSNPHAPTIFISTRLNELTISYHAYVRFSPILPI